MNPGSPETSLRLLLDTLDQPALLLDFTVPPALLQPGCGPLDVRRFSHSDPA
jgi:hypothetical protein